MERPNMESGFIRSIIAPMLAVGVASLVAGCASPKPVRVTVAELSPAARGTVEKVTAGGKVDQIDKEVERGRVVYDVAEDRGFPLKLHRDFAEIRRRPQFFKS